MNIDVKREPMDTIVFDIETGPQPREAINQFCPEFEAPANYKDPDKIAAIIKSKREKWFSDAALAPETGVVLCIGLAFPGSDKPQKVFVLEGEESKMLTLFWDTVNTQGALHKLVGFNSNAFDIPFLIRRSWALRISVPVTVFQGRYLPSQCVDIMDYWRLGNRTDSISLDKLARFLGVGEKQGSGADFAELYQRDRKQALAYLNHDVLLTVACAERLGVF